MTRRNKITPPGLCWRDGRPRWVPMPLIRTAFSGRDLKDPHGNWLGLEAAIAAATEINAEVAEWRAMGTSAPVRKRGNIRRSPCHGPRLQSVYEAWIDSPKLATKAASTRRDYLKKARIVLETFGEVPVLAIQPSHIYGWYEQMYSERGPVMSVGLVRVLSLLMSYARRKGWIAANPCDRIGMETPEARIAFATPPKVLALVEAAEAIGYPSIADAIVIALHTGQREGDVLAMPPRIFEDDRVRLQQGKTGAFYAAPMTPALAARIASIRERWHRDGVVAHPTIVVCETTRRRMPRRNGAPDVGTSYLADCFRRRFARVRDEAARRHPELCADAPMQPGLPSLRFADFRDTAVTRLAEAECVLPEIAAITGHSIETVASLMKHYCATTPAMADSAIGKLSAYLERNRITH